MLAQPFRALPRSTLIALLIVFLLAEAAGAAGLVLSNKASSAAPTPTATAVRTPAGTVGGTVYKGPPHLAIQNSPRTVINGHNETFAVRLKGLTSVLVTYKIVYPDGTSMSMPQRTDRTGYSKVPFFISYKLKPGERKRLVVSVYYSDTLQAQTDFAVQGS